MTNARPLDTFFATHMLRSMLAIIVRNDDLGDYQRRNEAIYQALAEAATLGYPHGIRLDPDQPDWPVAYIDLPTGQVSWRLPAYPGAWDGHNRDMQHARIQAFLANGST